MVAVTANSQRQPPQSMCFNDISSFTRYAERSAAEIRNGRFVHC